MFEPLLIHGSAKQAYRCGWEYWAHAVFRPHEEFYAWVDYIKAVLPQRYGVPKQHAQFFWPRRNCFLELWLDGQTRVYFFRQELWLRYV